MGSFLGSALDHGRLDLHGYEAKQAAASCSYRGLFQADRIENYRGVVTIERVLFEINLVACGGTRRQLSDQIPQGCAAQGWRVGKPARVRDQSQASTRVHSRRFLAEQKTVDCSCGASRPS